MSNSFKVELGHGQSPWFEIVSGKVIEESKRSETSVHHTATVSTSVYGTSGSSSATTLHDRTHSVWLSLHDGMEMEVELPSHDFSVRTGHEVSVAWGGKDGSKRGPFVAAVNHATGGTWTTDGAGLKPVVNFDNSLWGKVFVVSLVIGLLGGLAGGAAIGLGLMMGPAEIIAWFGVGIAKIPGQLKQHRVVSVAVEQLCAAMREDEGRMGTDAIAQRLSASKAGI